MDMVSDMPLSMLSPGEEAVIIHLEGDRAVTSFLEANEIRPGSHARVLASGKKSILVKVNAKPTTIARDIAERIRVKPLRGDRDGSSFDEE
jgi:Fe2+ transport system protein FeoA